MVQYSFTSTETRRLVRTESPGRPPRLSHSSRTMAGPCSGGILYAPQHSRCRHRLSQDGVASLRFVPEMRRYDLLWRCLLVGLLAKSRIIVCVAVLRFSILNLQFVVVIHLVHFRGQHEIDLLLLPAPATSSQHTHTHTHAHTLSPSLSLSLTHTHTHTHTQYHEG